MSVVTRSSSRGRYDVHDCLRFITLGSRSARRLTAAPESKKPLSKTKRLYQCTQLGNSRTISWMI